MYQRTCLIDLKLSLSIILIRVLAVRVCCAYPINLVPTIGFELMTYRLQGDCTTTVLSRRICYFTYLLQIRQVDVADIQPTWL
jgi:hypothetical protein